MSVEPPSPQQVPVPAGSRSTPLSPRRPTLVQRALALARRLFWFVTAFYCAMAVLGLITALTINRQVVTLSWPLVVVILFVVGYGFFAWFAEPLFWVSERRRQEREAHRRR